MSNPITTSGAGGIAVGGSIIGSTLITGSGMESPITVVASTVVASRKYRMKRFILLSCSK